MLLIKSLHIIFMVTWMAGLFYLPRLYVYHAQADDRISLGALQDHGAQGVLGHRHAGRAADDRLRPVAVAGLVPGRGPCGCTPSSAWSRYSPATTSGAAS